MAMRSMESPDDAADQTLAAAAASLQLDEAQGAAVDDGGPLGLFHDVPLDVIGVILSKLPAASVLRLLACSRALRTLPDLRPDLLHRFLPSSHRTRPSGPSAPSPTALACLLALGRIAHPAARSSFAPRTVLPADWGNLGCDARGRSTALGFPRGLPTDVVTTAFCTAGLGVDPSGAWRLLRLGRFPQGGNGSRFHVFTSGPASPVYVYSAHTTQCLFEVRRVGDTATQLRLELRFNPRAFSSRTLSSPSPAAAAGGVGDAWLPEDLARAALRETVTTNADRVDILRSLRVSTRDALRFSPHDLAVLGPAAVLDLTRDPDLATLSPTQRSAALCTIFERLTAKVSTTDLEHESEVDVTPRILLVPAVTPSTVRREAAAQPKGRTRGGTRGASGAAGCSEEFQCPQTLRLMVPVVARARDWVAAAIQCSSRRKSESTRGTEGTECTSGAPAATGEGARRVGRDHESESGAQCQADDDEVLPPVLVIFVCAASRELPLIRTIVAATADRHGRYDPGPMASCCVNVASESEIGLELSEL